MVSSPNLRFELVPKRDFKCDACRAMAPIWRIEATALYVRTGISDEQTSFGGDFYLCDSCLGMLQDTSENGTYRFAHAVGQRFLKQGVQEKDAALRAIAVVLLMRQSRTESRPFAFDVNRVDYRLGYTDGFAPGTLPTELDAKRQSDAQEWLARQTVDISIFELVRESYRHRFGYFIPNALLLQRIDEFSPSGIVDFGAGNGYLAYLLQNRGVDVIALDVATVESGDNAFWSPKEIQSRLRSSWLRPKIVSGAEELTRHPHRTLVLAWPPPSSAMAMDALVAYAGKRVVYIGEWRRATATDKFHEALSLWQKVEEVLIPTHYGMRDRAYFFER